MPAVLFVFTSANKTLTGGQTGWYLPEAAHPYYIVAPHADIDFASPGGPNPPVDEGSVKNYAHDEDSVKFLEDEVVKTKFATAKKLSEVDPHKYDAIFYVGGHGPVLDLAKDPVNIQLASRFFQAGKIVSAVCHGPAAILSATDGTGKPIWDGRKFTGFSNAEEAAAGSEASIPFLLETEITKVGGVYEKAPELWGAKVVVDGKLITGQNPASAAPLGRELVAALKA
ncbi:ThiJ/PfpI [Pluteus cervinus]|uniref:ThiJ/PfpI n=1 Tax=Pluteus cervinus TaxID=181527 RepID=A0ACD3BD04_9AGAR|nr:ThiJ/PfpI [Pluteus cervinus]